MIVAFDTYYLEQRAKTVGIAFENWTDSAPALIVTDWYEDIQPYEPGAFYKRELPCIVQAFAQFDPATIECIVIDGFVILDDLGSIGLGGHLYHALQERFPVIGVAKTGYAKNTLNQIALLRGQSEKPLFITSIGIELTTAATHIKSMVGEYRMPTLLKQLDGMTRVG